MPDKAQEQQAIALFIESFRIMHGVELAIRSDHVEDFPDFILLDPTANKEIWVEVVQAVQSGELLAAERRVQRLYEVAAQEYRTRGEEVVLTVTLVERFVSPFQVKLRVAGKVEAHRAAVQIVWDAG